MLHLSAKCSRSLIWWEDAQWRRVGQPFQGPSIPFGSLVEYHPIIAKDQSIIHQFGKKVLPGLFFGYALYAGAIWKGDVLTADFEELETMDASEIYSKRLMRKSDISPNKGEFIFPIEDGRIKTLGGDQYLRTSSSVRRRPIQGEWDQMAEKMMVTLAESGHPVFRPTSDCPEVSSKAKAVENCRSTIMPTRKRLQLFFAQLLLYISSVFTDHSQKYAKNTKLFMIERCNRLS